MNRSESRLNAVLGLGLCSALSLVGLMLSNAGILTPSLVQSHQVTLMNEGTQSDWSLLQQSDVFNHLSNASVDSGRATTLGNSHDFALLFSDRFVSDGFDTPSEAIASLAFATPSATTNSAQAWTFSVDDINHCLMRSNCADVKISYDELKAYRTASDFRLDAQIAGRYQALRSSQPAMNYQQKAGRSFTSNMLSSLGINTSGESTRAQLAANASAPVAVGQSAPAETQAASSEWSESPNRDREASAAAHSMSNGDHSAQADLPPLNVPDSSSIMTLLFWTLGGVGLLQLGLKCLVSQDSSAN